MDSQQKSQVKELYENANVLITGGTGFLGKVLVEKLLRDTNVSKIYLLVRQKKGNDIEKRLDELFKDVVSTDDNFYFAKEEK